MPTAVLFDGAYFIKRFQVLSKVPQKNDPAYVAKAIHAMALEHVRKCKHGSTPETLYRIFFYDCVPYSDKINNPISKRCINFSKTHIAKFRHELHTELKKRRKVALRLGYLKYNQKWMIYPRKVKELIAHKITIDDLTGEDVFPELKQKTVDMKIGIDITCLALKRLVKRIILVAGDGDFVPAAKLARKEGIDFILDPMWGNIDENLHEHIDGLTSVFFNKKIGNGY